MVQGIMLLCLVFSLSTPYELRQSVLGQPSNKRAFKRPHGSYVVTAGDDRVSPGVQLPEMPSQPLSIKSSG